MTSALRLWAYAARPKTLLIGFAPVLMGTFMALKVPSFSFLTCFCTLIGALAIQVGTNYSNDYFDFLKGIDTCARKGGHKILEKGLATPYQVKRAFIISFTVAALATIFLIYKGGLVILLTLALSIFFGIMYSAGPYSLSTLGISDLFVFLFLDLFL